MIIATKFMTTLQELFDKQPAASPSLGNKIEDIRQSMLNCIGKDASSKFPETERRVRFASNLEALWFLRPELLMAISSMAGELVAQGEVERISTLFDGLLPKSMSSRSSRVGK
jgi:hypothetical protein